MKFTPLKRKTPLKRGTKPLSQQSKKMRDKNKTYAVLRKELLDEYIHCACQGMILANFDGSIVRCHVRSDQVHHKAGRGKYHNDVSLFLAVCNPCHTWITDYGKEAEERGLIIRKFK